MAFTSSYTDRLIQQSQFFYGTPSMEPGLSGSFSGSFIGDGTNLNLASNSTIPSSNPFPFTGSAIVSGSVDVTGSISIRSLSSGTQNLLEIRNNSGTKLLQVGNTDIITIGSNASANSAYSQVWGGNASSAGEYGVVIGYDADHTTGTRAIAIGASAKAAGTGAVGIGIGAQATEHSIVLGRNIGYTSSPINSVVFNTFAGNTITYSTSNAFEWYNTHTTAPNLRFLTGPTSQSFWSGSGGFFGFGTTTPDAPLTVQGSGSTLFNVIGSEGTIFSLEDDLDGTLFTVNDRSGIPMFEVSASGRIVAEEGEAIIRSQRPIVTVATNPFTASLDNVGQYFRVGGNVTCSIKVNATASCPVGAEFDFFQTSSVGNLLFEADPGVTINSKNSNLNLAGQFSSATLKCIDTDEWDLMGDLT